MSDNTNLNTLIEMNKDILFSELADEINNDNVTDIEWDGYNLWISDLTQGCYLSDRQLGDEYV